MRTRPRPKILASRPRWPRGLNIPGELTAGDGHSRREISPYPLWGALKMQDMKMKDQVASHENAGQEHVGHEHATHRQFTRCCYKQ